MPGAYPVLLDLTGQCALVVGGGQTAARKAEELLAAGARVRLVTPVLEAPAHQLAGHADLRWHPRRYRTADLDGVALVVAATGQGDQDERVAHEATARNLPVHVPAEPSLGTFTTPSVLRRGDLVLAVAASGRAPGLPAAIVQRMSRWFGPEWATLAGLLDEFRDLLPPPGHPDWDELLAGELRSALRNGDVGRARDRVARLLGRHPDAGRGTVDGSRPSRPHR